jgi:hypothetical protein
VKVNNLKQSPPQLQYHYRNKGVKAILCELRRYYLVRLAMERKCEK